jgi:endonuclease/exonuclease/phosphatase family metal-dependent hydrolase
VDEDQITFGEACADDDCKSDKGAIYAKIEKDGLLFHVFGTHLQAGQASEKYDARLRQINLLKDFISSKSISQTEAVFIAGDLNEQMARASRFNNMLTLLDAEMPITSGMPYSSDPVLNDLNDGDERSYLDYVLYSNRHSVPLYGENQILLLRADTSWNLTLSGAHWDLSDHFPALGHFEVGSQ